MFYKKISLGLVGVSVFHVIVNPLYKNVYEHYQYRDYNREAEIKQDEEMAAEYMRHLRELYDWLETQDHLDVIFISYNELLKQPKKEAKKLKRFLKLELSVKDMVQIVDKNLYRQRA